MRVEREFGFIEYRLPDIAEMMILLGKLGVGATEVSEADKNQGLILVGKFLKEMKQLVTKISLKTNDGKLIETFEEAMTKYEFMEILGAAANEVFLAIQESNKKKTS